MGTCRGKRWSEISWLRQLLCVEATSYFGFLFWTLFLFHRTKILLRRRRDGGGETHAAMERLAADSGLTSATSLAFCRAIFWLAASSSSCSSCGAGRGRGRKGKNQRRTGMSRLRGKRKESIQTRRFTKRKRKKKDKRHDRDFKQMEIPWSVPVRWPNCPRRWPRTHWAECLNAGLKEILQFKGLFICKCVYSVHRLRNWRATPEFLAQWFSRMDAAVANTITNKKKNHWSP